jgi:putative SOS response-associated peptidase YedK
MCYDIAYFTKKIEKYQERFGVEYGPSQIQREQSQSIRAVYHTNGFSHRAIPVITHVHPDMIEMFTWGLIPFWVKDLKGAANIQNRTLNARDNTLFEKPAFRAAAKKRRCLVLVDGFYDHHWKGGKSFPFFIQMKNKEPFALGGIWEIWNKEGGERRTVAIITTDPNPMMSYIHNKPAKSETPRMPFIVRREFERAWTDPLTSREEAQQMILPFPEEEMDSFTVSRLRGKAYPGNVPEIMDYVEYVELKEDEQQTLF